MKNPNTGPNLFGDEPRAEPPVDLSEVARRIAQNAPHIEYPDRTSEAARDQGHGPVVLPVIEQAEIAPKQYLRAHEKRAEELRKIREQSGL